MSCSKVNYNTERRVTPKAISTSDPSRSEHNPGGHRPFRAIVDGHCCNTPRPCSCCQKMAVSCRDLRIVLVCWFLCNLRQSYCWQMTLVRLLFNVDWCLLWGLSLHWRHNDHDDVSNHQPHGCLLNRLFRRRSKKISKLRVTGLCVGNSPEPVNSPHKGPVTRKMFPFDDVIM